GPERGGQDDLAPDDRRPAQGSAQEGRDPVSRATDRRLATRGGRPTRHRLCARGSRPLQRANRGGESSLGALGAARRRRDERPRVRLRYVPDPPRARPPASRDPLGWRAADAGARTRDAAAAAPAHARRAVAGPGAPRRQERVRGAGDDLPDGYDHPAGGAERAAGARGGATGRDPRSGARRARGDGEGARRRRERPGSLSGRRGDGRQRQGVATLPQEEEMVMATTVRDGTRSVPALFAE